MSFEIDRETMVGWKWGVLLTENQLPCTLIYLEIDIACTATAADICTGSSQIISPDSSYHRSSLRELVMLSCSCLFSYCSRLCLFKVTCRDGRGKRSLQCLADVYLLP